MRWKAGGILGRLAQVLGLNSVPVAGIFGEGWSQATALAVYWVESLLVIGLIATRIVLHRRWTRKAGHFQPATITVERTGRAKETKVVPSSLLAGYLAAAIPFTLVHGIFLAVILFLVLPQQSGPSAAVSFADLKLGVAGVAFFLALGIVLDLVRLRERPFRWIELVTQRAMGRIFVLHLTILGCMFAMAWFSVPTGLFLVFAGLKTLFDFGGAFPHRELELEPPRWLRFLDRIKGKDGETFSEHWRRSELEQRAQREQNEHALSAAATRE